MAHSNGLSQKITLSSHNNGKCNTISNGVVSAAITINSAIPLFNVLVASLAPFLICFKAAAYYNNSYIVPSYSSFANGCALSG